MNASGSLLVILGVWLIAQLTAGAMLTRLGIVGG